MVEPNLSEAVKQEIKDIQNLSSRIKDNQEALYSPNPNPIIAQMYDTEVKKQANQTDAITGAIELKAEKIRDNLPENKVQELVNNLHKNIEQTAQLIPEDKAKLQLNGATAEAALKGFKFPTSKSGDIVNMEKFGLTEDQIVQGPIEAYKKAVVEVSNQNISREKYAETVINKTMDILKESPNKYTPEQLDAFKNVLTQGDKSLKYQNGKFEKRVVTPPNEQEKEALKNAAIDTVNEVNKQTQDNIHKGHALEVLEKAGIKDQKLVKTLKEELTKVDVAHLKEHGEKIANDLKIATKMSFLDKAKKFLINKNNGLKRAGEVIKNRANLASANTNLNSTSKPQTKTNEVHHSEAHDLADHIRSHTHSSFKSTNNIAPSQGANVSQSRASTKSAER